MLQKNSQAKQRLSLPLNNYLKNLFKSILTVNLKVLISFLILPVYKHMKIQRQLSLFSLLKRT